MSGALADKQAVVHAYRHLYRQGLKAEFDPVRISKTLNFLQKAAETTGIEHKIVRNLLMLKYWDQYNKRTDFRLLKGLEIDQKNFYLRKDVRSQFNQTMMLLNESLGTCLR